MILWPIGQCQGTGIPQAFSAGVLSLPGRGEHVKKILILCVKNRYTVCINTFHLGVISKIKCLKRFHREAIK